MNDGPSKHTDAIAAALAEYHAPATFFVTAQPANLPYYDRLPALLAAGHQIAMHSASHDYAAIYQSPEAFWLDIKALRQALEPYVPLDELYWLRFPGGSTNTVSHRYGGRQIMQRLIAEAEEKGYRWIDWNVCGEDATAARPDAAQITRNVTEGAAGRMSASCCCTTPPPRPRRSGPCPISSPGSTPKATASAQWKKCSQ